jgi:putative proteasome-type protease
VTRRLKLEKDSPEIIRAMEVWANNMKEVLHRLPRFSWEQDPL